MVYFALTYLHLVGATILLGTGGGIVPLHRDCRCRTTDFRHRAGLARWLLAERRLDRLVYSALYRDRLLLASRRLDADAHAGTWRKTRRARACHFRRLITACSGPGSRSAFPPWLLSELRSSVPRRFRTTTRHVEGAADADRAGRRRASAGLASNPANGRLALDYHRE
jgi:hypothetical protein